MRRLLWTVQRFSDSVWYGFRNANPIVHVIVLAYAASMIALACLTR